MTERVSAWECIGCGKIDASQPCIGAGKDRKVEFVYAGDHDDALAQLALMRERTEALRALVREIAHTTPRGGEWERNYRALQVRARRTLEALAAHVQSAPA